MLCEKKLAMRFIILYISIKETNKGETMFIVRIKFKSGFELLHNAGDCPLIADEIFRNNQVEYRLRDCEITLEKCEIIRR